VATILAHITVHPGAEQRFEELTCELWAVTHATEPDVRRYEYWRSAEPRTYYTLLAFADYHAFLAHQASDHHEAAGQELGLLIESLRLEWIDPVPGASALPATAAQPLPDDADDRVRLYAGLFAPEIARWWSTVVPTQERSS
jgi:quinol monooxygenase YgiN